jgi:Uma2 family endonuclease
MASVLPQRRSSTRRPPYPVRRWSVAEYHQLGALGMLTHDDRVELLEGWIVPKMTHYPPHAWAVMQVPQVLSTAIGSDWCLRIQLPIETPDSEPEPDVAIVLAPADRYLDRHPNGSETGLIVEIADSSLRKDRRKARIYARAGVPACWIVNLNDRQLEVHTQPDPQQRQYHEVRILDASDDVSLVLNSTPLAQFSVSRFLPPTP